MFVLDSHCDTPSQILRLRNLALDNDHAHVDFPKLKRGGVDGAFFALYVPGNLDEGQAFDYSKRLLSGVVDAVLNNPSSPLIYLMRSLALPAVLSVKPVQP